VEGEVTNLEAALDYASRGKLVFPCGIDKKPLTENGYKNATNDPEQIRAWWSANPEASIGMPTGPINGLWVLDIDMPDGPKSLSVIEKANSRLPKTLTQRTGGGGTQYFFKWNGHEIRNRTRIASNIDVRGIGGYVIVPPSSHPSGKQYVWTQKDPAIEAPEWLANMVGSPKDEAPKDNRSTYGEKALAGEIIRLTNATEGTRNDTLNSAAYSLGQLIAGGELDQATVEGALFGIALMKGLTQKETQATIRSGIEKGKLSPRSNPYKDEYYLEVEDQSNQSNQSNNNPDHSTKVIIGNQEVIKSNQSVITGNQSEASNTPYNLAAHIKDWITNSTGSFTNDQVDREFCLTTRKDKMNRAKILSIYKDKKIIKKDKTIKGKWHVIDSEIQWVDLDAAEETPFPIVLPFGLHEKVAIPKRAIIVLAGSTNAGKTAFILNTLRLNLNQSYEKIYLMSEMQDGEYKDRILGFGDPIKTWKENIKAASRSYDFNGTIQNYNPDGLTCVDYLEEIDGEYFKIPSGIRDIYDALGNGVAMIAIQKKGQADIGRGGEATKDKARLYMTLGYLCTLEHGIVCAVRLTKVKKSINENMQDKELHFKIERGSHLTVLMDWTPSSKVNRVQKGLDYQQGFSEIETPYEPYIFKTTEGEEVTLSKRDYLD
jgi:hypothetical protein